MTINAKRLKIIELYLWNSKGSWAEGEYDIALEELVDMIHKL